jgi:dihydrofolate reductase
MRRVTYTMSMSLDGFVTDASGAIDFTVPSAEVFRQSIDETREVGVMVMGRRLWETMLYWENVDPAALDDTEREWADLWNPLPKLVFSRSLTSVHGAARLATGDLATEIARLRAEPGEGDIGIGGATLAAQAASLGLIDEFRPRICPVILGGGTPYFPRDCRTELELLESRRFDSGVVAQRYRAVR